MRKEPIFFTRPFRTDLIVSLSMGVQANILVKIYFRENVVVTKNLSASLGYQEHTVAVRDVIHHHAKS